MNSSSRSNKRTAKWGTRKNVRTNKIERERESKGEKEIEDEEERKNDGGKLSSSPTKKTICFHVPTRNK